MTSPAKLPPDNVGAALMRFDGLRGHRYGEIILFGHDTEPGNQLGSIYNTVGLNDFAGTGDTCPQQLWDNVDPGKLAADYAVLGAYKNGPRLWCLDWVECIVGAERDFQGVKARWVMWLDVSKELREHESFAYRPVTGRRDTQFGIDKGSPAFILDDPEGNSWVMKSASLIADPTRTYEQLTDLGERLQPPPGWRYRTSVLDADLVLTPDNGTARITQDDLGNV